MKDNQDFTTGKISTKLVAFMLPILGALILQAMYSAVDLLIVGQFGTTKGLSGVSTGSSIMNMFTFIICSLSTGVTIKMGQYIGEGRRDRLSKLISGAIFFFAVIAIVISIFIIIFAGQVATLLQAPKEAMESTTRYVRICGTGFLFIVFYNFISSIFRGMGDSKFPLIFVSIACVVNIIGDLILVALLGMDEVGAALATVLAQAVSVILSIIIITHKELPFNVLKKELRFNDEVGKFLNVGSPLALQELLTQVSFLALCAFINRLGLDASAGYGVAQRIQAFIMLVPASIMQSMASFVAQNVGAGLENRAKKAMTTGMIIGSTIGVVMAYIVFFHGSIVAAAFTSDGAVIVQANDFLRGFALEAILTSILFSYMGYFNGHSWSLFVMLQGLAQSFLVRLPMSYIMSIQPNASLTYIGLAAPTATIFGIILCSVYYVIKKRETHEESANLS